MEQETIIRHFHKMLGMGLFVDSLLVNSIWRNLDKEITDNVKEIVNGLSSRYVHLEEMSPNLENYPYSSVIAWYCLRDTIVATASVIAHEETGRVYPALSEIHVAHERVNRFLSGFEMESLYKIYLVVSAHDIVQPLMVHKSITEAEFIQGIWHYPYNSSQLNLLLLLGLARDIFRLKLSASGRIVQLTKFGQEKFRVFDSVLKEVKYLDKRIIMSYVYQFDHLRDFDELCDKVWPDAQKLRRTFVNWVGLDSGSHILEVGCGTGTLTFEGGLCNAIGDMGKLTAVDISFGMLEQAKRKQQKFDPTEKVRFLRASVENLPFPSETFHACIGSSFLHFTNAPKAIAEMKRVIAPGGYLAILQGLDFGLDQPFFKEWFEPIFEIAKRNYEDRPKGYLPGADQLSGWFGQVGLEDIEVESTHETWLFDDPEIVVQHIVRGVSFFQRELMTLPWNDRKTIINELIDRGRDVCQRYSLAERTIFIPTVLIKGRRPL